MLEKNEKWRPLLLTESLLCSTWVVTCTYPSSPNCIISLWYIETYYLWYFVCISMRAVDRGMFIEHVKACHMHLHAVTRLRSTRILPLPTWTSHCSTNNLFDRVWSNSSSNKSPITYMLLCVVMSARGIFDWLLTAGSIIHLCSCASNNCPAWSTGTGYL